VAPCKTSVGVGNHLDLQLCFALSELSLGTLAMQQPQFMPKWKCGLDSWCPLKTRRGTPPDYSGQPCPELLSKCRENALTRNSPEPGIVPAIPAPE
jgi:hypothetical protein